MNLTDLFDLSFLGRRDVVALEFHGETLTFGEIDARSNRMANVLAERGFAAGDRLAVYLPNGLAIVDLFLACAKLGVIFVPINILYRGREIAHIVADAGPRAIVAPGEMPGGTKSWLASDLEAAASRMPDRRPERAAEGDDPAAIVYTSGTTGASKGAVLSHNNFAANGVNLVTAWQITAADRFLLPLPLFHVHALGNGLHSWLVSGCRMRLLERFEFEKATDEFLAFRPTLFFGVPTMFVRMLGLDAAAAREIGASMRLFVSGSAPLPPQVLEDFRTRFGHTILERYGMTETLMNISNPYAGERRAGTVGLPLPGVSIRVVSGGGVDVAEGEAGELYVRGPNVVSGYWQRSDATSAAFADGWFKTGDIATRSSDGYFTLHGRRSDVIISGGFNIYPREIEELLLEQEGVLEAAVVGVPHEVRGEVPVAYVVTTGPIDERRLEEACRTQLASFKVPRSFVRVDSLPRTALGKIQKHLLAKTR